MTSYATRTSPVLRGKWILENLLSAPPPRPRPTCRISTRRPAPRRCRSVSGWSGTGRTRSCAVCHSRMDPYGFGLENFDAIGRWRETEDGKPVDAADTLPDGTSFKGPGELRAAILRRPEEFVKTFTRKLLTYAVGRGLDYHDEPIVRRIVNQAARDQYRFSSIIVRDRRERCVPHESEDGRLLRVTTRESGNRRHRDTDLPDSNWGSQR